MDSVSIESQYIVPFSIVLTVHWRIRIFDDKLDSNNNDDNNNNNNYYYCVWNRVFSMEIIIIYVHRIGIGRVVMEYLLTNRANDLF